MARYKSKMMKAIEKRFGKPLKDVLLEQFNLSGNQSEVARELDVSKASISYWMLHEGIDIERKAVAR